MSEELTELGYRLEGRRAFRLGKNLEDNPHERGLRAAEANGDMAGMEQALETTKRAWELWRQGWLEQQMAHGRITSGTMTAQQAVRLGFMTFGEEAYTERYYLGRRERAWQQPQSTLTVEGLAARTGRSAQAIRRDLRAGRLPGAWKDGSPGRERWYIPEKAAKEMEPPRRGRPKG